MKRSVKILWRIFFGGLLFVILLFVCANFGLFGKMPSMKELENPEADLASEVYTSDGAMLGKYFLEDRSEVKYSQISPFVINALIATEDIRFNEHSGIDGKAIGRSVIKMGTRGGGSTITQQLAKALLGQGKSRTNPIKRGVEKIKEWIIAVKLERNFTKEEIITLYLNRVEWGNMYGIRNASKTYFQKEPKDLKIEEAAVLVGMLRGAIYDPVRHPKKGLDRRNTVLAQMREAGFLTDVECSKLQALPLITNYKKTEDAVGSAPYFRATLAEQLKDWCKNHTNEATGENYNLYKDGLKIYTTLNSRMQRYAEESVQAHMPEIQKKLNALLKVNAKGMWKGHEHTMDQAMAASDRWKEMAEDSVDEETIKKSFYIKTKMNVFAYNAKGYIDTLMTPYDSIKYHKQILQTSFVCMDPASGAIKCWVGGVNFKWFKLDHVTRERQVGSTFKPLLYTLAVKDEGYKFNTVLQDGPLTLNNKTITGTAGTMANCLAFSKNIGAWRLMSVVGPERTVEFAKKAGIKKDIPSFPSIALGAAEIPILQMLQSYTMFPNEGNSVEPFFITRIEDKNGKLLEEFHAAESKAVISPADAFAMIQMMQGVVKFGTGKSLSNYKIPVEMAGKTGTTDQYADGWFIGYTPELLAGTWVGCDDPFLRIYSGTAGGNEMALPNWGNFMRKVYADKTLGYGRMKSFAIPANYDTTGFMGDADFAKPVGTDSTDEDSGNGSAEDFITTPPDKDTVPPNKPVQRSEAIMPRKN
ncbi:MAG: transglycosylase domain-containing protein [Ferruginibacter sp.]